MTPLLKTRILFLPAIPLFFLLHGLLENFGFIAPVDLLPLAGLYGLGSLLLYVLLRRITRNATKAAVLTAWFLILYFFFGALHDFLALHASLLSKYSVLLPLLLILSVLVWIAVRRAAGLQRPVLLLNLVFLSFLCLDTVLLTINYIHPPANKLSFVRSDILPPGSIAPKDKPDIYFLVFDEYASSVSLQKNYGYHNDIDAWLTQKGFRVQPESFSNYNYTAASLASILNMSFIEGMRDSSLLTARDINYCLQLIKKNEVMRILSAQDYDIINCSPFELQYGRGQVSETLLPVKTRLISSNTLWSRIERDLLWTFYWGPLRIDWLADPSYYDVEKNNLRLLQLIKEQSYKKESRPVFVYGHVYMPHDPFFMDKNGNLKSRKTIRAKSNHDAASYLEYLAYTNTEIKKLVDTIQANTAGKAVIMVMGDHGFRENIELNIHSNYQDLNAVYFPNRDYHLFYDSVSTVNQFKIVFNTLFHQSIPLLKDSTIFLTGK
ncbi:MAG TPA: sulfatase-like hydrolase/transferase [Chitinophagaceae bacterium]|jgi:hypothetical protein